MHKSRVRSDRGAILVYVAVAIAVLMAFSAFVVDYGVFWLARGQAQNAADAGALAGAVARAYDEPAAASPTVITLQGAQSAATANLIAGEVLPVSAVEVDGDPATACPDWAKGQGGPCVRVSVYRDRAHGNALGTYFGPLFGSQSLDVQATATAQVRAANTTDCLKPFMMPDRTVGGAYVPAGQAGATAYTTADIGSPVVLDSATLVQINVGQSSFDTAVSRCDDDAGQLFTIGEYASTFPGGVPVALFVQGFQNLIDSDSGASWDSSNIAVRGSCAPGCGPQSPRIVTIPLFDPTGIAMPPPPQLLMSNFLSVFVTNVAGTTVNGYIVPSRGRLASGASPPPGASFLNVIAAIR
jgi:Flp pilus assembly protein TadG